MATKLHSLLARDDCIMPDGSVQKVASIVRAVNSHSDLIEALEGMLEAPLSKAAAAAARAALAKAKGE